MVRVNCVVCGMGEGEVDERMGHVVCGCGMVVEENVIVSEVTFSESSRGAAIADGFTLGSGQARASNRGAFGSVRPSNDDSRETTLRNGHRRIAEVANMPQIHLSDRISHSAQRLFNLAVTHNFTKGRKASNVIAACLYTTCRLEKTAHMLIDFADALNTNVFQLGATYLALTKIIAVDNIPVIDPAIFISRFAAKLDFADKIHLVIKDANRVVQRMNRDWIQIGRRPSGICAAALFIAARMHAFDRSIREIIMVVKICEATLRKRLHEFKKTPSSSLSVSDFQTIWLEDEVDPPSFAPPSKHRKLFDDSQEPSIQTSTTQSIHSNQDSTHNQNQIPADHQNQNSENSSQDLLEDQIEEQLEDQLEEDDIDEEELVQETQSILKQDDTRKALNEINSASDTATILTFGQIEDDHLSDLDSDEEIQAMIDVSQEEIEFKTLIWTEENKDWIQRQELKRALDLQSGTSADKRKPKKKQKPSKRLDAPTAAEAARNLVMSKPTLSKKINYGVLDTLFEKTEPAE